MENHAQRDLLLVRNLRDFSRGKDGPGGVTQDEKSVFEPYLVSKLQGLALQAARGSENCYGNQTGEPFAKETSTARSSH
jgi:hypothetical protein